MFCKVSIIGRLTKDVEPFKTGKGVKTSIAFNSTFKNESGSYDSNFIDVAFYDKNAENATLYLNKGDLVFIDGHLNILDYNDNKGMPRRYVSVIVSMFRSLMTKKDKQELPSNYKTGYAKKDTYQGKPIKQYSPQEEAEYVKKQNDEIDFDIDSVELPF